MRATSIPGGVLRRVGALMVAGFGLAAAPTASAECANSWHLEDLIGVAPDGGFVTRERSDASMGSGGSDQERFDLHGPDGAVHGSIMYCAAYLGEGPAVAWCPAPDVTGPAATTLAWYAVGDAPAELFAGKPSTDEVARRLVKRLALVPPTRSRLAAKVADFFVRVGPAVVEVLRSHDIYDGATEKRVPWRVRALESPRSSLVFVERQAESFRAAYDGTCGWEKRVVRWYPKAGLVATDPLEVASRCFADDAYEWPDSSIRPRYACLVAVGDPRLVAAVGKYVAAFPDAQAHAADGVLALLRRTRYGVLADLFTAPDLGSQGLGREVIARLAEDPDTTLTAAQRRDLADVCAQVVTDPNTRRDCEDVVARTHR